MKGLMFLCTNSEMSQTFIKTSFQRAFRYCFCIYHSISNVILRNQVYDHQTIVCKETILRKTDQYSWFSGEYIQTKTLEFSFKKLVKKHLI